MPAILQPVLLLPVMSVVFVAGSHWLDAEAGYLLGFVISTFFLALPYGYIAYRTGSARWTAISHSLSGILALSGYLAPCLLTLIGGNGWAD